MSEHNYERGINVTVRDLKEILEGLPDDMDVITTVSPEEDANIILSFRHIRTAGVLSNPYEPKQALCLAPAANGLDMHTLIHDMRGDTSCEKLLF